MTCPGPFSEEFHPTWYPGKTEQGQVIFVVRVHTDEGITSYANMGGAPWNLNWSAQRWIMRKR